MRVDGHVRHIRSIGVGWQVVDGIGKLNFGLGSRGMPGWLI